MLFCNHLRNYYSKRSLLPKGGGKLYIWCIWSKEIAYLFALYKTAPYYLCYILSIPACYHERINKKIFPMQHWREVLSSFSFCVLCMDSCFKLSLIFSSFVIGTVLWRVESGWTNLPSQISQPNMLSLLSLAAWVGPACWWCQGITSHPCAMLFLYLFSPGTRKLWRHLTFPGLAL